MKPVFLFVLICVTSYAFAQENELDRRNGFKDIKLASPIDSVKGAKFKKDGKHDHFPIQVYTIEHPDYSAIGEVKIISIEVKTYKGLIYQIYVVTEKDTRLMKGMEGALGKATYNMRDDSYNWSGEKAALKFRSHSRNQLSLDYTSTLVFKMMAEDKKQKIKDISSDF